MTDSIGVVFPNLDEWEAAMDAMVERANVAAEQFVQQGGELIAEHMKAHARVRSGANRASIGVDSVTQTGEGTYTSLTGPRTAYGRREEMGFHGRDSIGRDFTHDPGHPYAQPGLADATPDLDALHTQIVADALEL